MKKNLLRKFALALFFIVFFSGASHSQFSLTGQLRTRTEIRDGLGNLALIDAKPAAFTSQRTRLSFGYKWDKVNMGVSVQDVRVWGQDASSISNSDGARLAIHEAWAEIVFANVADTSFKFKALQNLSLKIGRQELVYDDVRLLGNLDWLQQGRRFDAVLLKAQHKGWALDIGGGFNQNNDAFGTNGTYYVGGNVPSSALSTKNVNLTIPTGFLPTIAKNGSPVLLNAVSTNGQNQMFKSFQMAYLARKFKQTKLSVLFFKDDFSKYRIDSIGSITNGYVYGRRYDQAGVNSRLTYGAMLTGNREVWKIGKVQWQVFGYLQSGKDRDGLSIKGAYHYGANFMVQRGPISFGPGYEVLSGNDGFKLKSGETHRFDPLYGTPHKHWGYMDYFYVGTGAPAGGLQDAFVKVKHAAKRLITTLDIHYFALAAATPNKLQDAPTGAKISPMLGMEYDVVLNYTLNKFTAIELGYSLIQGNNSLEYVKQNSMDKTRKTGQWGYLMLNIRPDFFYTSAKK